MSSRIPHCYRDRHGTYYYRAVIPIKFRACFPALPHSVRFSLRTKNPREARLLSLYRRIEFKKLMTHCDQSLPLIDVDTVLNMIERMKKSQPGSFTTEYFTFSAPDGSEHMIVDGNKAVFSDGYEINSDGNLTEVEKSLLQTVVRAKLDQLVQGQSSHGISGPLLTTGVRLSELVGDYIEEKQARGEWRSQKRVDEVARKLEGFVELMDDPLVNEIQASHLSAFAKKAVNLPPANAKEAKGKSLKEQLSLGLEPRSKQTTNNHFNDVRAFLRWAYEDERLPRDFSKNVKDFKAKKKSDKTERRAWTVEELQTLFDGYVYRYDATAKVRAHGNENIHAGNFWIPLIGLFTGARLEEICSLLSRDICQVDGVWCFDMPEFDEDGESIKKNEHSARVFPVPNRLKELGFIDYAQERQRNGAKMLFELQQDSTGKWGDAMSDWFNRTYKKKLGLPVGDNSIVFHSFRNTVVQAFQRAKIPVSEYRRITGHAGEGIPEQVYGYKGESIYPPQLLVDTVNAVDYPQLDLSHLSFEAFKKRFLKKPVRSKARARPKRGG